MKVTEKTEILKYKGFILYKTNPVYGGCYAIVNNNNKTAKTGLSLNAAFDLFNELTLEATLRESKLIS